MSNYSNETLTALFKNLEKKIDEGFEGIHERQDKTNGRIGRLEQWRSYITGGLALLTFLVGVFGIYILNR